MFRAIVTTLLAFLFVVGALAAIPFFIPPSSYHATVEKLISDNLGREVRIRELHYQLLPLPHITGSNITILSPAGQGEAVINKVDIWLSLQALAQKRIEVRRVHFAGLASNQQFIESFLNAIPAAAATADAGSEAASHPVTIERVSGSSLTFRTRDNRFLGPFEFDARLGGPRGFQRVDVALADESATISVQPLGEGFDLYVTAHDWTPPLGPPIRIEQLRASAVLIGETLQVNDLALQALGGTVEGNANIAWPKSQFTVDSRLNLHGLPLERVTQFFHAPYIHGNADGIVQITTRGATWAALLSQAQIVGDVTLRNGYVGIPSPVFAFDQLAAQVTLTAADARLTGVQARANGADLSADTVYVRWLGSPLIRGAVKSTPMPLEVVLAPFVRDNPLRANVGGEVQFELAGENWASLLVAPKISGRLALSDIVLNNPGLVDLPVPPGLPWVEIDHMETGIQYQQNALRLTKLQANVYGGSLGAKQLLIDWHDGWTIAGEVAIDNVVLEDLLGHMLKDNYVSGTATARGELKLAAAQAGELANNAYFSGEVALKRGRIHAQPITDTSDGHQHHSARTVGNKPLLFYFDEGRAEGTLADSAVTLSNLQLKGYGGEFRSSAAQLSWRDGWQLTSALKVAGVQLEPLINPFVAERVIAGNLDAELDVKLKNTQITELFTRPTVLGKFLVSNGVVYKADLEKAGKGIVTEKTSAGQTRFDTLSGDVFLKNRKLRISALQINSPSVAASGHVKVDPSNALDGSLTVSVRGSGGLLSVPLNVAGTVDKPSYALTGGAMLGGALGTSVLGPGLGTLVGVQTGKVFSAIGSLFTHNKEEIEREQAEDMADEPPPKPTRIQ